MLNIPDYIGESFVGQKNLKNRLNFYLHNQRQDGFLPFTLFQAPKGSGKTHCARALARNLLNLDKTKRRAIEISGATLDSVPGFVESILIPHISGDQEITVFIDEIAETKDRVLAFLLSILQPNAQRRSNISYSGQDYVFDFHRFNFICATTHAEKLGQAFKSRFARRIEIEPYSSSDLIKILYKNSIGIEYKENVEDLIISCCRKSPRETVLLAQNEIVEYCKFKNIKYFGLTEWDELRKMLDIKSYGLNSSEVEVLKALSTGPKTLTGLSACLGLDTSTIRKEVELYLLNLNLMIIDQKRILTNKGMRVLKEIENI
ncbi:MAG: AAA family ATPase [Nanoarchaeota archaeon]